MRTKPLSKIDCGVEVILDEASGPPTYLEVCYFLENRKMNKELSDLPKPFALEGHTYTFRSRMRAPARVGLYRLRADAVYVVDRWVLNGGKSEKDKRFEEVRFSEWGPLVEIKP